VAVGASAGGVQSLIELVSGLPSEYPGSVFVVLHLPPDGVSLLPRILERRGPLPASTAEDGKPIEGGHIYVAPPDYHLLLQPGLMRLSSGPRENRHRPAVDTLFRSAAAAYGPRVAGVVLSGMLDDGTLGLIAIKAARGTTIVQDPNEALFPGMPMSAAENADPDYILPVADIPMLLQQLVQAPRGEEGADVMSDEELERIEVLKSEVEFPDGPIREGRPSVYSCPDCGGTLWEIGNEAVLHFRCRVGHAYAPEALVEGQTDNIEGALWSALRALDENLALTRRLHARARARGQELAAERFAERALEAEQSARLLRKVLKAEATIVYPLAPEETVATDEANPV
jgi:two-component system chemotaxis response regulator CheB